MAFDQMKRSVEAIKNAGMRDKVKIMIGGSIMDASVMLDEAKPENLKAMIDFTRKYGV